MTPRRTVLRQPRRGCRCRPLRYARDDDRDFVGSRGSGRAREARRRGEVDQDDGNEQKPVKGRDTRIPRIIRDRPRAPNGEAGRDAQSARGERPSAPWRSHEVAEAGAFEIHVGSDGPAGSSGTNSRVWSVGNIRGFAAVIGRHERRSSGLSGLEPGGRRATRDSSYPAGSLRCPYCCRSRPGGEHDVRLPGAQRLGRHRIPSASEPCAGP
jgi:hypothetical protein